VAVNKPEQPNDWPGPADDTLPELPHMPPGWVLDVLEKTAPQWKPLDVRWQYAGTIIRTKLPARWVVLCERCDVQVQLFPVVAQQQLKPKNVAATFLSYLGRCDTCGRLIWCQPDQGTVNLGQPGDEGGDNHA